MSVAKCPKCDEFAIGENIDVCANCGLDCLIIRKMKAQAASAVREKAAAVQAAADRAYARGKADGMAEAEGLVIEFLREAYGSHANVSDVIDALERKEHRK